MPGNVTVAVDTTAPTLFVDDVLRTTKMVHDIQRQRNIVRENRTLVKRMNHIHRTHGFLGINYDYRVAKSLHYEQRMKTARRIERENLVNFTRIVQRKPTVDSNLPASRRKPVATVAKPPVNAFRIHFWERTDVDLGCVQIIPYGEGFTDGFKLFEGKVWCVYRNKLIVLQSTDNCRAIQERKNELKRLANVESRSLLKTAICGKICFLITCTRFPILNEVKLIGKVGDASFKTLSVLNDYGSTFGRPLQPMFFQLSK